MNPVGYAVSEAPRGLVTGAVSTTIQTISATQVLNGLTGAFTETLNLITGTQAITATAFDAVGNATTITATIHVQLPTVGRIYLPIIVRNYDPNVDRYESDNVYSEVKSISADGTLQYRNFYPAGDIDWARLDVTLVTARPERFHTNHMTLTGVVQSVWQRYPLGRTSRRPA